MYTRQYKNDPAILLAEAENLTFDPADPKFAQRVTLVCKVLREGMSPAQVAEIGGYPKRSVQGWVSKVEENGWDALRSSQVGRPNKLSAVQIDEVKHAVLNNPKDKGYNEWTGKTLAEYIGKTYHIEYGASAATKLMVRLGLRTILNERSGRTPVKARRSASTTKDMSARKKLQSEVSPRKQYTSDITREQYRHIQPLLESVTVRDIDLYDYFCAALYIATTSAQWENLPGDLPNHKTAYHYFRLWTSPDENGVTVLDKCLIHMRTLFRNNMGKKDKPTLGIVDAKSIKNVDTAREKGYDAGKKVSGIKLHILVDTLGLPHAIHVTRANTTDRELAVEMVSLNLDALSDLEKILVDGGYTGQPFSDKIQGHLPNAEVEVVKRNELHTFKVLPKRWIVERSFGWLEKFRRLWKNCEKSLDMSLQMTVLAFVSILLKRF